MKKILILIVIGLAGLTGVLIFLILGDSISNSGSSENTEKTSEIPNISFLDYEGDSVNLTDFAGTPLVINSWAAWCPFCVEELQNFATVQQEVGQDVLFVAINRAESLAVAKKFSDDLSVTQHLIFLLDPEDVFYKTIGAIAMPETIFIDAVGNIAFHKRGVMNIEEIRQRVELIR